MGILMLDNISPHWNLFNSSNSTQNHSNCVQYSSNFPTPSPELQLKTNHLGGWPTNHGLRCTLNRPSPPKQQIISASRLNRRRRRVCSESHSVTCDRAQRTLPYFEPHWLANSQWKKEPNLKTWLHRAKPCHWGNATPFTWTLHFRLKIQFPR